MYKCFVVFAVEVSFPVVLFHVTSFCVPLPHLPALLCPISSRVSLPLTSVIWWCVVLMGCCVSSPAHRWLLLAPSLQAWSPNPASYVHLLGSPFISTTLRGLERVCLCGDHWGPWPQIPSHHTCFLSPPFGSSECCCLRTPVPKKDSYFLGC